MGWKHYENVRWIQLQVYFKPVILRICMEHKKN